MKQSIRLVLIILTVGSYTIQGQDVNRVSGDVSLRRYVMDVRLINQNGIQSGVLFDLTDSTVLLAPIDGLKPAVNALIRGHNGTLPPTDSLRASLPLQIIRYDKISRLTLHRRGHAAKGFLLGAGAGVLTGFIKGGDEPGFLSFPASFYALAFGLLLSPVGLIVGAASTKSVNVREQSVAAEVPSRFRRFTIVEQVNQANLYRP